MALISATPWTTGPDLTYQFGTRMYGFSLVQKRKATTTVKYEWTCDVGGGTLSAGPGGSYVLASSGVVWDDRFKRVGRPAAGVPCGTYFEVWTLEGDWQFWNGSSWVDY